MGLVSQQIADFVRTIRKLRVSNQTLARLIMDLIDRNVFLALENRDLGRRDRPLARASGYDVFVGS